MRFVLRRKPSFIVIFNKNISITSSILIIFFNYNRIHYINSQQPQNKLHNICKHDDGVKRSYNL